MCGVVARLGSARGVEYGLKLISYRGTRQRVLDGPWGAMGHVRLPIVGLGEEYDQPVESGDWVVGFVGEILDFREMRPGQESDVPLVVDMFTRGASFGDRDGFWAIFGIDRRSRTLHLLCDYLAQKPIYYREDLAAAASELSPLVDMGETTLDELYLSDVVKWGYCPDPRLTPYREVRRVLPGEHVILFQEDAATRTVVDRLRPRPGTPDELKQTIEDAVRRRVLSSDVPVAALVSGGLDSAIVYTLAKRYGDVHAFHVENGEKDHAEAVLNGSKVTYLDGFVADRRTSTALDYMQEPIDLGSLLPQIALAREIAATVCLTGDGADEFFGGYGRASRYDSQASDVWRELVAWHLPRLDRVMMRHRVEVRSPFLARRVAEMALALPWHPHRQDKKILRDLFRHDLPPGVADTPKKALRTAAVLDDREAVSRKLVRVLRERHQEDQRRWR